MAAAVGSDIDSFIREQKAKLATERQALTVSIHFGMFDFFLLWFHFHWSHFHCMVCTSCIITITVLVNHFLVVI